MACFRLDGQVMSKPHRAAAIGQILTFAQVQISVIRIVGIGSRRGPASEAMLLYEDLAPRQSKLAIRHMILILRHEKKGAGRPTKRERRLTERLKPGL